MTFSGLRRQGGIPLPGLVNFPRLREARHGQAAHYVIERAFVEN